MRSQASTSGVAARAAPGRPIPSPENADQAQALAASPPLILADEPSGNLDHANAESLHEVFATLASEMGVGLVVVTHNRSLASRAGRILLLEDGTLHATRGEGLV